MQCRDRESAGTEHQVSDNPCCRIICGRIIRVVLYIYQNSRVTVAVTGVCIEQNDQSSSVLIVKLMHSIITVQHGISDT